MLKRLLFITALFCLFSCKKYTPHTEDHENWVHMGSVNNKFELFANLKARTSDIWGVRIWTKMEYYKEQTSADNKKYIADKILYLVDCEKQSYRTLSFASYNQAGEVVDSYSREHYLVEWDSFIPDTVGFAIYKAACDK